MKPSLLLLLFLISIPTFAGTFIAQTGKWQDKATWGGRGTPHSGDSIFIPAGVTVTLARPANAPKPYFLYDLDQSPTKLRISGTLLLGDDTNLMLYGPNQNNTSVITVDAGGVIMGGNNGTHIKITGCEMYEGGVYDPNDPRKTAHPLVNGVPMIVGPTIRSAATPEWCFSPLPIRLVNFKATYQPAESRVKLEWLTAQEVNNDYFTIERSSDARHFSEIARIPGAGNSSEQLAYEYYDSQPLAGTAYYRLRQTDYDGKNTLSKIVSVTADGAFSWRVSPNLSNGNINLLTSGEAESLEVRVFSSIGKLIYQGAEAGLLPIFLSAGMYYVWVSKDGQASTQKMVVQ
jgi:hypothetical protein